MTYKIQVLALNDDNHDTSYHTRSAHYSNAEAFMKECLLKAHLVDYEVHYVWICDDFEEDIGRDFDIVSGLIKVSDEERRAAFDKLWEYGTEDF